ncbi:MAG TPA: GAK system CofD-like protein, partial [Polyangiaceae bacterium]|nr:GAK system CofD-like protein [Polyangiaceae bacterium]
MTTSRPGPTLAQLMVAERLAALRSAPALGPALLFFSGGTALRPLCRKLKLYTHRSIHVITPFDSGGSSAEIRRAFSMLSVGDLRNRLLALADESGESSGPLYRLFSYRLPKGHSQADLKQELLTLAEGVHPLVNALSDPVKAPITSTLRYMASILPGDFDLAGANVGNLLLTGIFLSHDRDMDGVMLLVGKMLGVLGTVLPASRVDAQLAVRLLDGEVVVGQHRITGKEVPALASPIEELFLTRGFDSETPIAVPASAAVLQRITDADLVCYPYGSFYSSVLANLLPRGIGSAVAAVRCPKVYVPNWGKDPEQLGMTLSDTSNSASRVKSGSATLPLAKLGSAANGRSS